MFVDTEDRNGLSLSSVGAACFDEYAAPTELKGVKEAVSRYKHTAPTELKLKFVS